MASPIDHTVMLATGSTLTLNGSTFGVGLQGSASALKSVSSLAGASGVWLSNGVLTIRQAGFVLDGYDLRGVSIIVTANNVTIKNSLGGPSPSGKSGIYQELGASGLTVEYCTFDGQKSAGSAGNMVDTIVNSHSGSVTIRNNEFINIPSDAINMEAGTVARNYFSGSGYQNGAHADAISVQSTTGPVIIRENYIDNVKRSDAAVETNSAIKIVSHFGAINNVTVESNVILGGGYSIYVSPAGNPISNVKIADNDIGMANWGDLFPGDHGTGFVFQGNYNFKTDAHLLRGVVTAPSPLSPTGGGSSPFDSLARAASLSEIKATIGGTALPDVVIGTTKADVIKLGGGNDICLAGGGNDVIVGGAGKDYLAGNAGKDAFVFTSIKDSAPGAARDLIFDWKKSADKIDLHLMDANSQMAGNQAFTWIGGAGFSGHAGELRFTSGSKTVIGGDVNGDGKADFQIELAGRHSLTASDFIL